MIGLVIAMLTAQAVSEAYAYGDESLVPGDVKAAGEVFRRVCMDPFPDGSQFATAMTRSTGFTKVDPSEVGTIGKEGRIGPGVGGVWTSPTIIVRYIAVGAVAPTLPQPQCLVTLRLVSAPEPAALALALGTQLGLGSGRRVQAGPYMRTLWDLPGTDGVARRVVLKSASGAQGNYVLLSIVRLQEKK